MTPADFFDARAAESEGLLPALGREGFAQACAILAPLRPDPEHASWLIERCCWAYIRVNEYRKPTIGQARRAHAQILGLAVKILGVAREDLAVIDEAAAFKERLHAITATRPPPPARPLVRKWLKAEGLDPEAAGKLRKVLEDRLTDNAHCEAERADIALRLGVVDLLQQATGSIQFRWPTLTVEQQRIAQEYERLSLKRLSVERGRLEKRKRAVLAKRQ